MTIGYTKVSEYIEKLKTDQEKNIREFSEISQDKLSHMPEKSAITFHHNFYQKWKIDLEDATISDETQNRLQVLKQNYNDIGSQNSCDIGLTYLEEMAIDTDPELPYVAS